MASVKYLTNIGCKLAIKLYVASSMDSYFSANYGKRNIYIIYIIKIDCYVHCHLDYFLNIKLILRHIVSRILCRTGFNSVNSVQT